MSISDPTNTLHNSKYIECIEACNHCANACDYCADMCRISSKYDSH